ncbi:MAG: acetate--CoA ligase family protein [bacterium]
MNLEHFFFPKSIAVVGASRNPKKLGNRIFRNLREGGFRGRCIPVNPTLRRCDGVRAYPTVGDIPGNVDCAVIVTPAATVSGIVGECGKANIKNCVVISAGFREIGGEGERRERELRDLVRRYRINLLGPNCLGFLHGGFHLNASFGNPLSPGGDLVLISQSGAMAVALTDWAREIGVGFRAIVSLGNKAGLDEVDMLRYFTKDPKTSAILFYLESVERGEAFCAAARNVVRSKPVIVLKAGESSIGQRAALSHTGALASARGILDAAFASAGILQAHSIRDLSAAAMIFTHHRPMKGNDIAIITNAGGPAIMAADAVAKTSLSLAQFSNTTQALLRRGLPEAASIENPVDCVGDADEKRYERAMHAVANDPDVHGILVVLTPQVVTRSNAAAKVILRCGRRHPALPIVASFLGGASVRQARRVLSAGGIPHYAYPEDAITALALLRTYQVASEQRLPAVTTFVIRNAITTPGLLMPPAAHSLLRRYGFRIVPEQLVQTEAEALRAARSLGFPVALKAIRRNVVHKEKAQAVLVGISSPAALRSAIRSLLRRFGRARGDQEGFLVQHMVRGRSEWFCGGKRDPSFGPVVLLGFGGTDVEERHDVRTFVPPFSRREVERSIHELAARDPSEVTPDVSSLYHSMLAMETFLRENPAVGEVDINPLLVGSRGRGAIVVDARIVVEKT